jgi:hypothetical protein
LKCVVESTTVNIESWSFTPLGAATTDIVSQMANFDQSLISLETTTESGDFKHEHIDVNQRELSWHWRQLVRVDGLERATNVVQLNVRETAVCVSQSPNRIRPFSCTETASSTFLHACARCISSSFCKYQSFLWRFFAAGRLT